MPIVACLGVVLIVIAAWIVMALQQRDKRHQLDLFIDEIGEKVRPLQRFITQSFLVQPCPRCHESDMRFLSLSPNARSIHYQCLHCDKTMYAAATTPDAHEATAMLSGITDLINQYAEFSNSSPPAVYIDFETSRAPLPYEQTSRTPIPEAVRSEVWRRDGGRCVECGSQNNLQFDHMIPVSRGGATSAQNLQLLCQKCNLAKGVRI